MKSNKQYDLRNKEELINLIDLEIDCLGNVDYNDLPLLNSTTKEYKEGYFFWDLVNQKMSKLKDILAEIRGVR